MKILPIRKSSEFQKISKKAQKFYSKTCLLLASSTPELYLPNQNNGNNAKIFCRVGYTVSKSISKLAVKRNLAKRRLRQAFAKLAKEYAKNHYDYVVIARNEINNSNYDKIFADLKFCLKRIHQTNNKDSSSNKKD